MVFKFLKKQRDTEGGKNIPQRTWRKISTPVLKTSHCIGKEKCRKVTVLAIEFLFNSDITVKLRLMWYQRSAHNNWSPFVRAQDLQHWWVLQLDNLKMIMKADVMGLPHTSALFCASPIPWINMFKETYKLRISINQRYSNKEIVKSTQW